jgi:hypothetical protein
MQNNIPLMLLGLFGIGAVGEEGAAVVFGAPRPSRSALLQLPLLVLVALVSTLFALVFE